VSYPQKIKCPNLNIILKRFTCELCNREFPSYFQVKNHLYHKLLGNNETPTFRKLKTENEFDTTTLIPINICDEPFKEVKTGLIYIDTKMEKDMNLFFIRSKEHFRPCAVFDDEKKSCARLDAREGKMISVGISQVHCIQFVYNNFETFKALINLYKSYLDNKKKADVSLKTKQNITNEQRKIKAKAINDASKM
jgi:hypothetical protein